MATTARVIQVSYLTIINIIIIIGAHHSARAESEMVTFEHHSGLLCTASQHSRCCHRTCLCVFLPCGGRPAAMHSMCNILRSTTPNRRHICIHLSRTRIVLNYTQPHICSLLLLLLLPTRQSRVIVLPSPSLPYITYRGIAVFIGNTTTRHRMPTVTTSAQLVRSLACLSHVYSRC